MVCCDSAAPRQMNLERFQRFNLPTSILISVLLTVGILWLAWYVS